MKEATRGEAISIAHLLDVNKETVWGIIKGMQYSTSSDLAMAVHMAFSLGASSSRLTRIGRGCPNTPWTNDDNKGGSSDDRYHQGRINNWIPSNLLWMGMVAKKMQVELWPAPPGRKEFSQRVASYSFILLADWMAGQSSVHYSTFKRDSVLA